MAIFIGNGNKVKIPSEIKPHLVKISMSTSKGIDGDKKKKRHVPFTSPRNKKVGWSQMKKKRVHTSVSACS